MPSAPSAGTAFQPANPPEMKPIASHNTPAYRAAKLFKRGANLGNYLEVPPGQNWGVTFAADECAIMRAEGFDHVRVPVGWHHYAGPAPDFTLSPEIFARMDFVVTNALKNQLAVMINIHHFDELDTNPAAATDEFLKIWRQIAAHYRDFPRQLAFELDNEPHAKATTAVMNPIYARAIAEIRKSNPRRTIFVEPGNWGSVDELKNLALPPDDNVIVSVHCYEPFYFTHQGANSPDFPDEYKPETLAGVKFLDVLREEKALDWTSYRPVCFLFLVNARERFASAKTNFWWALTVRAAFP